MNIIKLFDNEEITNNKQISNNVENISYDRILEVLNDKKLSSYQIYKELKKKYSETKYTYTEINKLCSDMVLTKNSKKICKEGRNPCVFYVNTEIIIKNNNKKRKNIEKETTVFKKYNLENNIKYEKKNEINVIVNDIVNINEFINEKKNNTTRLKALDKVLEYQYDKFISTKNPKYLDNINELTAVKDNI